MKARVLLPLLLFCHALAVTPLSSYMQERPIAIKLGYTPSAEVIKAVTGDQRYVAAEWNVLRVLFYFGSLVDQWKNRVELPPEYYNMFKTLETAVRLDPYNMDAYYFCQAAFTWEVGRAADVNRILDYGMRYRTWDFTLPYFAGFNAAYFLKDFNSAARYMQKAAELSGDALFTNLAARFYYEADRNDFAIRFLESMQAGAKNDQEREVYALRLAALKAIRAIEEAANRFREQQQRFPHDLQELVTSGMLSGIPTDPYGGTFYLDEEGRVRSTSKLALPLLKKEDPSSVDNAGGAH